MEAEKIATDMMKDRVTVAILAVLYSTRDGKMSKEDLLLKVTALDVNNMTERQWRGFNRRCSRLGKWRRSGLYKWLHTTVATINLN